MAELPSPQRPVLTPLPTPAPLWRELVGDILRQARQERGLRLLDVATRAGVSPQYLSEVERGRKDASSELLAAITGALDLTVLDVAARATGLLVVGTQANPVLDLTARSAGAGTTVTLGRVRSGAALALAA